jgi:HEPN domain-containing protein
MEKEERIKYWTDLSNYDIKVAEAMLRTGYYLYVGFMCHQVIEKIFKAYYSKLKDETPPYVHKLTYLAKQGDFMEQMTEDQVSFIVELEPLNIEARYPDYKKRLLRRLTKDYCEYLILNTKELLQWTKERLL